MHSAVAATGAYSNKPALSFTAVMRMGTATKNTPWSCSKLQIWPGTSSRRSVRLRPKGYRGSSGQKPQC